MTQTEAQETFNYKVQRPSFEVKIHIAGNYNRIEQVCSDFVTEVGQCVNVKPTNYIYTYGEQSGAEIGLISYPRFPSNLEDIRRLAVILCERLLDECNQESATIIDNEQAIYISRKSKDE